MSDVMRAMHHGMRAVLGIIKSHPLPRMSHVCLSHNEAVDDLLGSKLAFNFHQPPALCLPLSLYDLSLLLQYKQMVAYERPLFRALENCKWTHARYSLQLCRRYGPSIRRCYGSAAAHCSWLGDQPPSRFVLEAGLCDLGGQV